MFFSPKTLNLIGQDNQLIHFEATNNDKFKLDQSEAKFEFNISEKTNILYLGGEIFVFKKNKIHSFKSP